MSDNNTATVDSASQTGCTAPQSTATPTQPMTSSTRCEQLLEFTDHTGTRHRMRFIPQSNDHWQRVEETWNGQEWVHVSQETVSDLNQWTRPVQTPRRS